MQQGASYTTTETVCKTVTDVSERTVGFDVDPAVLQFQVRFILAADLANPAVAAGQAVPLRGTTPGRPTSPRGR